MSVLSSQFSLLLTTKLGIEESNKLMMDEFDLIICLYEQHIRTQEQEQNA